MPVPVLTVQQMRQWEEATWASGRTQIEVIQRAGRAVAAEAMKMSSPGEAVIVLAGAGHNGDDARHARPHLHHREVFLIDVQDPKRGLREFVARLASEPTLIVDGLFGIGLNRQIEGDWRELIEAVNRSAIPTLAIDVPSGLNAESGLVMGTAIRADVTLTLGAPKRGLLATTAWAQVGRLEVAPEIGLSVCEERSDCWWTSADDFTGFPPRRAAHQHKGSFGHVGIVAGSLGYHGAAVLCARGALRAQPGLVSLICTEGVYTPVASQSQAAMIRPWRVRGQSYDEFTCLVIGPGLAGSDVAEEMKRELARCWQTLPIPVIADATALDWLPRGAASSGRSRVITPHPGEAARMLCTPVETVQRDRAETVRELSRRFGECWVALKGHQTCVGKTTGEIYYNSSGNPRLAQGGSGDLLAGYLGGLLAQPALISDPLHAIRFGVWQHGAAADRLTRHRANWGVEDLAAEIGKSLPGTTIAR